MRPGAVQLASLCVAVRRRASPCAAMRLVYVVCTFFEKNLILVYAVCTFFEKLVSRLDGLHIFWPRKSQSFFSKQNAATMSPLTNTVVLASLPRVVLFCFVGTRGGLGGRSPPVLRGGSGGGEAPPPMKLF